MEQLSINFKNVIDVIVPNIIIFAFTKGKSLREDGVSSKSIYFEQYSLNLNFSFFENFKIMFHYIIDGFFYMFFIIFISRLKFMWWNGKEVNAYICFSIFFMVPILISWPFAT
jgi:hypothetical protein